jgi:hypothetical protein
MTQKTYHKISWHYPFKYKSGQKPTINYFVETFCYNSKVKLSALKFVFTLKKKVNLIYKILFLFIEIH